MRCDKCGYENEDNTRFCIMCGQPLQQKESPAVNQPPVQGQPPVQYGQVPPASSPSSYPGEMPSGYRGGAVPPPPVYPPMANQPPMANRPPVPNQPPMANRPPMPGQQQMANQSSMPPPPPPYVQGGNQSGWQSAPNQGGWQRGQSPSGPPRGKKQKGRKQSAPSGMPPQNKKKASKGKIIGLSILAILVVLVAAFLIFSLPLRPEIKLDGIRQTLDGKLSKLSVEAKANQFIQEIYYALDPSDPADADAYEALEDLEGGSFEKTGSFPRLSLDRDINKSSKERGPWKRSDANSKIGNHTLYVRLKTLFGMSDPVPFNLQYASGISSQPNLSQISKGDAGESDALSNEILVSLTMGSDRSVAEQIAKDTGGKIVGEIPVILRYQLLYNKKSAEEMDQILATIRENPNVEHAQYNYVYSRSEVQFYPNDPKTDQWDVDNPDGNNWGLEAVRAPIVWEDLDGFTPISIGVADGGLEYDHEDLNVDRSHIFLFPTYTMENLDDLELYYAKSDHSPGSTYYGMKSHGTHVTGIMSEIGNNGVGTTGVNWNTVPYFYHYWHMSVDEDTGELDLWNVTTSFELEVTITTLVEQGCRVINFSVGDTMPTEPGSKSEIIATQAYGDLCLRLESLGYDFLIFKAAGNESMDASAFEMNRIMTGTDPGRRHTVLVASVENSPVNLEGAGDDRVKFGYRLADYSNYGSLVDVAAPGSDIYSTVPNQGYDTKSGTSMASPMAAGVASLIYGAHPEYYASQVKAILMEKTDTFTTDGENLIPVVNAALSSDYAKTGEKPALPPGQVIPDPAITPYPGVPTPTPPEKPTPGTIQLPGHTPFVGESGKGGLTGFVCDQETKEKIALFSLYLDDGSGNSEVLDFAYPYPETYTAQLLGEFFTTVLAEDGKDTTVSGLVIEARGYKPYEVPAFTVRGGEVTDLGNLYLEPESEDVVRVPGHTPFPSEEGWGGFAGFVYDDVTKQPIPEFKVDCDVFDSDKGETEHYTFEYKFPPNEGNYAQLKGEYIILVLIQQPVDEYVENLTISAEGYETAELGTCHVIKDEFTDAGIVYLKPIGTATEPTNPDQPEPTEPTNPSPTEPDNPTPTEPAPDLEGSEVMIELTWGANPEDLDLHVTAPLEREGRTFHLFDYGDYTYFGNIDDPDAWVEDTSDSGYGPENVIIPSPEKDLVYTVYVHDFTNTAKQSDSNALGNSGAVVTVYFGDGSVSKTFSVPKQEGTLWKVCEIRNGEVTGINQMSYEGRPLNIGKD